MQDGRGFRHLHHEGALPRREVVAGAHAREHAIAYSDVGPAGRDEGTDVRHERDEPRLAQHRGLPRHVRAGDDQRPAFVVQPHVVRDEGVSRDRGLDDGVPALFDVEHDVVAEPRAHVVLGGGDLGEAGEEVDLGDVGGRGLDPPDFGADVVSHRVEEPRLELRDLIVGPEDLRFPFLEFRREIALGVGERLPAGPLLGNAVELRARDLEIVPEHLVEPDLQRVDAGALALPHLHAGDEVDGAVAHPAQFVEFGGEAGPDHAPVLEGVGGLGVDGFLDAGRHVPQRIEAGPKLGETARLQRLESRRQPGQRVEREAEAEEFPRGRPAGGDAGGEPLQIADRAERASEALTLLRPLDEFLHGVEADRDLAGGRRAGAAVAGAAAAPPLASACGR